MSVLSCQAGAQAKGPGKKAQVQGAGFRLGLPPKNLALSPAAEMRGNFRRLRLHEPGPQNRVGQETMDPCQSLFEPLKPLSNVGLPNASLASPLPPLPSLTVVKNLPPPPMSPLTGLLRRISTYSSQPR